MLTFCIPSKNNLRYLKGCIASIKTNSYYDNKIIVFVDGNNDNTAEWLHLENIPYILNESNNPMGIGYAYDTMFNIAETDLVCAFHADMILGVHADYHLIKHHKEKTIVCSTRIEPPLHPASPDKIVKDFGMWPEDINLIKLNTEVKSLMNHYKDKTTQGLFAPWLINKNEHIGHDPIFLSVFEDSDLFLRYKHLGYNMIQAWDSIVYHLTCRGGQFEHNDLTTKSSDWKHKSDLSSREFIRKWGVFVKRTEYYEPIPSKKYNIGFIVNNCNTELLSSLEPWCSNIYVDCDYNSYIKTEQPNTTFNLIDRVHPYYNKKINNITVSFDGSKLTNESFQFITQLSDIITESGDIGTFEYDIFTINIMDLTSYELDLIKLQ